VKKATSEKFRACRERVHDDAFEAQIALYMVAPLLKNALNELKLDYLRDSGLFLRRALVRYLALGLCRLLDKPNDSGKTGMTASISSLLVMAEGVLGEDQIQKLTWIWRKSKRTQHKGNTTWCRRFSFCETLKWPIASSRGKTRQTNSGDMIW